MNKMEVAVATITWARDKEEEALLREALQELAKLNMRVFITDGGSGATFLDFIKSTPNFVLLQPKGKGVWAQARTSLKEAYQSKLPFILYTEPDKKQFFQTGLQSMLNEVIADEKTGIITASRSARGFASFPAFQQMTETTINNCCSEIIGNNVDGCFCHLLKCRKQPSTIAAPK